MDAAAAVAAPRIHHQWSPDQTSVENTLARDTIAALEARGHKVAPRGDAGAGNTILVTPRGYVGAADQRTRGALAAGY
jgi:gamma-glutamyltranspeptidase/glutathione hydrolase